MSVESIRKAWDKAKLDKTFLFVIVATTTIGFFIFLSAVLGEEAKNDGSAIGLISTQLLGLFLGSVIGFICYKVPLEKLKDNAVPLYIGSLLLTLAVFIPGFGWGHGGATRWLALGPLSFQPAEILKITAVIMASAWFSYLKSRTADFKLGFGGILVIIATLTLVLLPQPDTGNLVIIIASVGAIYFVSGAKWKHVGALLLIAILALGLLASLRPYVNARIMTFINPTSDILGAGWQTNQSIIAVGSGGLMGRGPGQSIQKYGHLPEPIGDSIFAVFAEEYGFIGSLVLMTLFGMIGVTGFKIASKLRPGFEKLLVTGLVTMILVQSFLNIGAMIGVFPLSGKPLIFISHGGTAMMFSLAAVGLILQASKRTVKIKSSKIIKYS